MIAAFVERREPMQHTTFFGETVSTAATPEHFAPDDGQVFDPVLYSRFLGGRGRPVAPASQDVYAYFNPGMRIGGMGSSWDYEFLGGGKAVMPSSLVAVNRSRSINRPRTAGFLPWAVRSNAYRPPWQSFSESADQASADTASSDTADDDTPTPIGGW